MKPLTFPMNYFANTLTPTKMFTGRKNLSIWQMFVVFIFLFFLMMNPVVLKGGISLQVNLEDALPGSLEALNQADMSAIHELNIQDSLSKDVTSGQKSEHVYVSTTQVPKGRYHNALVFQNKTMQVFGNDGQNVTLHYTSGWNLNQYKNTGQLDKFLNQAWQEQTAGYRRVMGILLNGFVLFLNLIMLVFIASLFLWMTKKSHISSIETYKESVNLTLNALFLGTLVAVIFSFFSFNVMTMVAIQSFGLILAYLLIFLKTKLNDQYVSNQQVTHTLNMKEGR